MTTAALAIRRVIGVPDYERYLAHMQTCHPAAQPLDANAFTRDAAARRYDHPGSRCC